MKKIILLILISFSFRVFAQTNVYHPFPESDAVWTVYDQQSHYGGCCDHSKWDRSYFLNGDTIINGKTYNKLYKNEHHIAYDFLPPGGCLCDFGIVTDIFMGGLRNDSANRKVYFYNAFQKECLLYDFDLAVGDSVADWHWPDGCQDSSRFYKVSSIDSALVGSNYHKRFNIQAGFMADTSIIEGVGSMTGLLGPYSFFENGNQLVCFSVSNQTMYVNPKSTLTCGVVGIHEMHDDIAISISPNPGTGIFSISSSEKLQYEVFDIYGRRINQTSSFELSTTLDLTSQPKGIYFIRGKSEVGIFSKKIILQ